MRNFLAITKALSDETRVRALVAMRGGELCLCHVIELLELSPSTVSKHLDILCRAGLVERRKQGRWAYFRLAGSRAPASTRRALRWVLDTLKDDSIVARDGKRLATLCCKDTQELVACYRS